MERGTEREKGMEKEGGKRLKPVTKIKSRRRCSGVVQFYEHNANMPDVVYGQVRHSLIIQYYTVPMLFSL